jgi:multiple sugar transport system permease protein
MKEVPREPEEAARIDGAGEFRIFWSVVLPTVTPALGVIGVFGFTMIWDQYLLPLGIVLVASTLAMMPSIIAFQRSFMRGISVGAIKG